MKFNPLPFSPLDFQPDVLLVLKYPRAFLIAGAFILASLALWLLFARRGKTRPVARLGGLTWKRNQFCRGWLITGDTGSGKFGHQSACPPSLSE